MSETIDGAAPFTFDQVVDDLTAAAQDPTAALLTQRAQKWGDPVGTHVRIAQVWSGILGVQVQPQQVADCMVGLKLVRDSINPDDPDSLDDAAGYVRIGQMIQEPA